jgi:hypothetical protein
MIGTMSARQRRALAALPLLILLTAARTVVEPIPETMQGIATDHPIGETFIAHRGDVILRAKVMDTEVVTLDAPVSVTIAKFSQELAAGTRLQPVLAIGKTEQLTGASGRYYCSEDLRTRSKFAESMIGDMFSKYGTTVSFCFVDSGRDGTLDQVFLSGAKKAEEQGARPIQPTPYTTRMLQPDDEAGEIELQVAGFNPRTNKVEFQLRIQKNGERHPFSYIVTVEDGKPRQTYPDFKTNPRKVPYPAYFNDILGAGIGVIRVDAEKGEAAVQVNRNFPIQLFKPVTIQVQYIYIYY